MSMVCFAVQFDGRKRMKNKIILTSLSFLFALIIAYPTLTLANGTIKTTCIPPQEEVCPVGCPCPEGWGGAALDPRCTPPYTESCEVTCCFNDGFYVGGQVGYLNAQHKYNVTLNGITTGTFHKTKKQDTVTGGILLGGRYFIHPQFFLGAEVSANMDGSSTRFLITGIFGDTYLHKLKREFSIIPSAVFGATFAQAYAVYIKLGADISKFRSTIFTLDGPVSSGFTIHKSRTVFLPTVGAEYCFSPTISTRLEVSHNFQAAKVARDVTTLAGNRDRLKIKAYNTAITLGLLYKF